MLPRARLVVLAACLGAAGLSLARDQPPAPVGVDAPPDSFSAARARDRLADLLADEAPHPVGSAAGVALRARLVAQLRALGLAPEEQASFTCTPEGRCAPVVNVLVRVPGTATGPAVLLASHHDSVPAGPGAADDGHGVAVMLEVLRAVLTDGPTRTPLLAVFTDGEEAGLLGARAFVARPEFAEVGVVVNIEARGTGGLARMFETSDGNAALIAAYAAGAPRPSAHSLSYEIYKRLPNDTDLTIFKRAGAQGLGFAFIGGVQRYHTPLDDLAHLDLGSVQQQGDSVLGLTRALLAAGPQPAAGNASYADLLGLFLLRWPSALDLPLAGLALALLLFAAWRARALSVPVSSGMSVESPPVRARAIAGAAASALLAPLLAGGLAHGVMYVLAACSQPFARWTAAWTIALVTISLVASAAAVLGLRLVAGRVGARAQALGVWLVWAAIACAVAVVMPGASVLFIAPALLAGAGLLAGERALAGACAAAGALACVLWPPLVPALLDALGLDPLVLGALVGWTWTVASPALADDRGERHALRLAAALALAGLVVGVLAARTPRITAEMPARLNIMHVQDLDSGAAHLVLDPYEGLPPEFTALGPWRADLLPWSPRTVYFKEAEALASEGPTYTAHTREPLGELRRISATLRPRPGAASMTIVLPPDAATSLRVGGQQIDPSKLRQAAGDRRQISIMGPPAEGVELIAEVRGDAPWLLVDAVPGLPGSAAPLSEARLPARTRHQSGDLRVALRSFVP